MEWILAKLVSTTESVAHVVQWSIEHPEAAAFWGPIILFVLNYIVKKTPTQVDDSIFSAVSRAVKEGVSNLKAKKGK